MILKYVLKNFSRRKVRTILMVLSLVVSTGLIVTMENANFENSTRLSIGAPVRIDAFSVLIRSGELENPSLTLSKGQQQPLKPRFVQTQLASVPGFYQIASLSYP